MGDGTAEAFIVEFDDWRGLYIDGDLVYENHSLPVSFLAEEMAGRPFLLETRFVEEMPEACVFPATKAELDAMYDYGTGRLKPGFPAYEG